MTIKQQVINARENGSSYSQITKDFGVAKSTAQGWVNASEKETTPEPEGFVNDNFRRFAPDKPEKDLDTILDFLSQLSNVTIKSDWLPDLEPELNDYALVIGDTHFGSECNTTLDLFYQAIDAINPSTIILNGDTLDMTAISRYPKDIRHTSNLKTERDAYHKCLATIREIAPHAKLYETNANHSGNSVESRWWRYLSERLGELACIPEIKEKLSYESVFLPASANVELVDYVELAPDFYVMHGDVVRKNGAYSVMGMLEKWNASIMMNHTHRVGMTALRRPGIGNKKEHLIKGYENGCACDLSPVYASAPNWQNGFSIVSLGSTDVGVEQVIIKNGSANVATLGCTLKAS
jgi:hypothetical protein